MNQINVAVDIINENDPNFVSSIKVKRPVYGISCYTEVLMENRLQAKHLTLDALFRKKADNYSENEPQPAPSWST
jgi:hypothetical protein